jgi:hypothetical protein
MRRVNISTIDNPYDPFEDYISWYMYDTEKGYYSSSKVARLLNTEDGLSTVEEMEEYERAVDRLIEIDPFDIFIKIVRED